VGTHWTESGNETEFSVVLENRGSHSVTCVLNPNDLQGHIYVLKQDGTFIDCLPKEYWRLISVGVPWSCREVLAPGESRMWSVSTNQLVDGQGHAITLNGADVFRAFCELDAVYQDSSGEMVPPSLIVGGGGK